MPMVEFKGNTWNTDEDGFIDDFKNWNKDWVEYTGGLEGVSPQSKRNRTSLSWR